MRRLIASLIVLTLIVGLAYGNSKSTPFEMTNAKANQIADAIYVIEGGAKTKHPYGVLSVKTSNPRKVCLNTIINNHKRWQKAGAKGDYLDYLANVYCPVSADPKGNSNWKKNIHRLIK